VSLAGAPRAVAFARAVAMPRLSRLQLAAIAYFVVVFGGTNFLFVDAAGRAATNPVYAGAWGVIYAAVGLGLACDLMIARRLPLDAKGLLFAAIPAVSAIWSIEPGASASYGASFTLGVLAGALLAVRMDLESFLDCLLKAVQVLAAASIALLLIAPQHAIYNDFMQRASYLGLPAISGVMPHKNAAALAYVVGLTLLLARRERSRPLAFGGWLTAFLGLGLASGSALFPVLALVAAAFALLSKPRGRSLIVPLFIAVVAASSLAVMGVERLVPDWVYASLGRTSHLTGRTAIWAIGVGLVAQHPWLGYGFEAAFRSEALYQRELIHQFSWYRAPHAHNSYLQAAIAVGLPAAAAMFAVLGTALAAAANKARSLDAQAHHLIAFSAVILIFCVAGASENFLMQHNGVFAVLAGALMAYVRPTFSLPASPRQPSWKRFAGHAALEGRS
jgi:O-antigen ligase